MAMPQTLQQALAGYQQGPVSCVVDPDGAAFELYLAGGVEITLTAQTEEVETDILGVYDLRTTGFGATFELNVPEQHSDVVKVLFPDGADATSGTPSYFGIGKSAGQSLRALAKTFRFRPWQTRTSDADEIVLWKCVPAGDATWRRSKTEPHAITRTFRALPDPTKPDGSLIGRIRLPARS